MTRRVRVGLVVGFAVLLVWIFVVSEDEELEPLSSLAISQPFDDGDGAISRDEMAFELSRLREEFARERASRKQLEEDLTRLRGELESTGTIETASAEEAFVPAGGGFSPQYQGKATLGSASVSISLGAAPARERDPAVAATASEPPVFDTGALVNVGIHSDDARYLRERWEEFSLDRLELLDQANREGWRHKPRFRRQALQLETEMLEELGEEGFDQLLYASGRPNRVIVRDVLAGSMADEVGLRPGDTILRYDDLAVFDTRKLQAATARGEIGEMVRLEVFRDGEFVTLDVERGPLGAMMRAAHQPPAQR